MNDAAFIFGILTLLGAGFFYLMVRSDEQIIGVASGGIGFVLWGVVAGWWLDMQTNIPGIALLFYGLSMIHFIFTAYGSFRMMRPKKVDEG